MQIDMESSDFDSYLQILRPGQSEPLASNDDRGGDSSLHSRIFFTFPEAGSYIVRATRLYGDEPGDYRIRVGAVLATRDPEALGPSATGTIDRADPIASTIFGAVRHDPYSFESEGGERIQIDLASGDFDSKLIVLNERGEVVTWDDNSGGERNARAMFEARPGRYVIRAGAPPEHSGPYTLTLARRPAPAQSAPPQLDVGQPRRDSLSLNSRADITDRGRINTFYQPFRVVGQPGQVVTIEVSSSDFQPMLEAGVDTPIGFAIARRALSRPGGPTRLVLRPTRAGPLILRVRSVGNALGAFTINATLGEPPDRASAPLE